MNIQGPDLCKAEVGAVNMAVFVEEEPDAAEDDAGGWVLIGW